jgi:solute carrier family 25 protein 38
MQRPGPALPLASAPNSPSSASLLDTMRTIASAHGYRGLWRGSAATLWRTAPGGAIYFFSLHQLRGAFDRSNLGGTATLPLGSTAPSAISSLQHLVIGGTARGLAALALHPFSVVKTRAEAGAFDARFGAYSSTNPFSVLRSMLIAEGWRSWYRGILPTLARDVPFSSIYVSTYEFCKRHHGIRSGDDASSRHYSVAQTLLANSASSVCAATVATVATQVQDVLKTRAQLATSSASATVSATGERTFFGVSTASLWRGMSARLARKVCMTAFTWTVFEAFISYSQPH